MGLRQILARAATALRLETARTISLSGDIGGSVAFDGSQNVTISTVLLAQPASYPPLAIASNEVFSVPSNKQVLFSEPIDIDGMLDLEGILSEVN